MVDSDQSRANKDGYKMLCASTSPELIGDSVRRISSIPPVPAFSPTLYCRASAATGQRIKNQVIPM
jgi:hypothetical protein